MLFGNIWAINCTIKADAQLMSTGSRRPSTERQQAEDASTSGSWADFETLKPSHPLLARFIDSYTYSVGCLMEQSSKFITRAYPTVMTEFYFEFAGDLSEIEENGQRTRIGKRTYVKHGVGNWVDIFQLDSKQQARPIKNLKVDLYPSTLFEIFNLSPQEVIHEDLMLEDIWGIRDCALMLDEMEAACTGTELIRIFERYFLPRILSANVDQTCRRLPGLPEADERLSYQAHALGRSERWLQKRYAEIYGMSFKQMQSNLRFHKAHRLLWQHLASANIINLSQLAYSCGYFDQAHFIKEFKRFTGMTPGQYLKSNFADHAQYLWYW